MVGERNARVFEPGEDAPVALIERALRSGDAEPGNDLLDQLAFLLGRKMGPGPAMRISWREMWLRWRDFLESGITSRPRHNRSFCRRRGGSTRFVRPLRRETW